AGVGDRFTNGNCLCAGYWVQVSLIYLQADRVCLLADLICVQASLICLEVSLKDAAADDGLGRPILVNQPYARSMETPGFQIAVVQGLAADHQGMSHGSQLIGRDSGVEDAEVAGS